MQEIQKDVAEYFLKNQERMYDEPVAETVEEAIEFLEDCMAMVFEDIETLKEYLSEDADITDMSDEDIEESLEVFKLPDGRYLLVEA